MKDLMTIKIPPATMAILCECDELDPFARELLLISQGKFKESSLVSPLERAAITSIAEATEEAHARRVAAGSASAKSRLAVSDLPDIVVPEIVTPSYLRGRTICGQNVTPKLLGNVRYVMLARNFGPDESLMFFNYTFSELIKHGIPTPSGEEIMCKAKQWHNFKRGERFPSMPWFHDYMMIVMGAATPVERGYLLDLSISVKNTSEGLLISGCSESLNVMRRFRQDLEARTEAIAIKTINTNFL